jgi:hypothetical protein
MSIFYSIEVILNLKYEKNNITYLFQKCIENNIHCYVPFSTPKLNSSDASEQILNVKLENEDRYIHSKFQDTDCSIWIFKEKNNLINFSIGGFSLIWRKDFLDGSHRIDFARYIRLLLRVCNEFTILALETSAL